MTRQSYSYKSVKISPEAHQMLVQFAAKSGKTFIDVLDKIVLFIDNNKITYPQLSRTDTLNPAIEKLSTRLEDSIAILRSIETSRIDPISKCLVRIETDVYKLVTNIEINKNLEISQPVDPIENAPSLPVPLQTNNDFTALKNAKEVSDLRVKEAVDLFNLIRDKLAKTSSGYKRTFTDEEVEAIDKYIRKCTVQ